MRVIRFGLLTLSIIALVATVAFVFEATSTSNACPPSFADEFNGTNIDPELWSSTYKSGRTELQYYAPDSFEIGNGILRIKADKVPQEGKDYTSGALNTRDTFAQQYGYFEIRAKVPSGQGLWPAFWLLHTGPLPWAEIDVFEILGHETEKVYLYNHWRDANNEHQSLPQFHVGADFSEDFHTYAVDWRADRITWYVDGLKRAETRRNVHAEPMFMIINLAVGGQWPGSPDKTTQFPAYFDIDYVRVYPEGCLPPKPVQPTSSGVG
jgi:beta-glucanase (GH16 family)